MPEQEAGEDKKREVIASEAKLETAKSELTKPTKKKSATPWKVVTAILALAVVGTAGFLTYHFLTTDHTEKQCEETVCEFTEVKDEATGEVIKVVKVPVGNSDDDVAVREIVDKLYNTAVEILYPGQGYAGSAMTRTYNEEFMLYQPEGWKTSTFLNLSYGFRVVRDDSKIEERWGALQAALVKELSRNGFAKYDYGTMAVTEYINEQRGIVCGIDDSSLLDSGVECASVNWYDVDDLDLINDLAEAYNRKTGEEPYYIGVNKDKIEDSGYEQYQKLIVSFAGAMGQFYRVSPDSEWVFFRGGQDAPLCSEFNTEDLKRAFVGDQCWNETTGTNDTVKL